MHPVVSFTAERVFRQKGDFLSRDKNNALMIALFSTALTNRGCHVSQSPRDADVNIMKCHHWTTILVRENRFTDLSTSLPSEQKMSSSLFPLDANKQSKEERLYDINISKETLEDDVCNGFLFWYMRTQDIWNRKKVSLPEMTEI